MAEVDPIMYRGREYRLRNPQARKLMERAADFADTVPGKIGHGNPTAKRLVTMAVRIEAGLLSADDVMPEANALIKKAAGEEADRLMRILKGAAPKALATGVAAKLMLGGVAKAAGAPGVTEAMQIAGREQHTPTEFIRSEADSIAEMLGLATGYQGREPPRYDARREAAIRATMRSGREGLRPAPGETPITPEEVEAYQRRRR